MGEHAHGAEDADAAAPPGDRARADASDQQVACGCQRCPVCALLHSLPEVPPEVSAHLRAAGREVARALQVWLDPEDREHTRDPGAEAAADPTASGADPGAPADRADRRGSGPAAARARRTGQSARVQRIPLE